MSKVTVVIPLYNQKEFVAHAIESVLNQSISDIEVIVVDDGSTDNPAAILEQFGKKIEVIEQQNQGLAAARNAGLSRASGEFIQFLDADDFLHRDKIALQLRDIEEKGSRISYCEVFQYDMSSGQTFLRYVGEIADLFPRLYNQWLPYPLPIHSLLFHRSIFEEYGGFPEDLKAVEDRYFLSILVLSGEKISYFPFIGGGRRLHRHNMNKNRKHIYEYMVKYYKTIATNDLANKYQSLETMANANLTYMFFADFGSGTPIKTLREIKSFLDNEGVCFSFKYIPRPDTIFKPFFLPLLAGAWRCRNYLKRWIAGNH